jgi:hypothetical protein
MITTHDVSNNDEAQIESYSIELKSPAGFPAGLGYRIFRFFIVATALTPDNYNGADYAGGKHGRQD